MDTSVIDTIKELISRVERLEKISTPQVSEKALRSKIMTATPEGYDNAARIPYFYNHEDLKEYAADIVLSVINSMNDEGVISSRSTNVHSPTNKTWIVSAYYKES